MSSDQQRSLTDFDTEDDPEPATDVMPTAGDWTPSTDQSDASNECQKCGAFVDSELARVFGDNNDEMHGCFECMDRTAVREGGALPAGGSR